MESSQNLALAPLVATTAARRPAEMRVIDAGTERLQRTQLAALPAELRAGDVVVINTAATLPATLRGVRQSDRAAVEVRLLAPVDSLADAEASNAVIWQAAAFGGGDWRTPTERRPLPPALASGDRLIFGDALSSTVQSVERRSTRLITLAFPGPRDAWLHALYRVGSLVQYAYHERPLELWHQQTLAAVQPVALEAPSAALHLTWKDIFALREAGVEVVPLTHATGISSAGDAWIDAHLPFPERYEIPAATARRISAALAARRRVIAVGTGSMRALESAAAPDGVRAGSGETTLRLSPRHRRQVVTGLLTGMHDAGSSHMQLLGSLVGEPLLTQAYQQALAAGYLWHEYGDLCLIFGSAVRAH